MTSSQPSADGAPPCDFVPAAEVVRLAKRWLHLHPLHSKRELVRRVARAVADRGRECSVTVLQLVLSGARQGGVHAMVVDGLNDLLAAECPADDSDPGAVERSWRRRAFVSTADLAPLVEEWRRRQRALSLRQLARAVVDELERQGLRMHPQHVERVLGRRSWRCRVAVYDALATVVAATPAPVAGVDQPGVVDATWVGTAEATAIAQAWLRRRPSIKRRQLASRIVVTLRDWGYAYTTSAIVAVLSDARQHTRAVVVRAVRTTCAEFVPARATAPGSALRHRDTPLPRDAQRALATRFEAAELATWEALLSLEHAASSVLDLVEAELVGARSHLARDACIAEAANAIGALRRGRPATSVPVLRRRQRTIARLAVLLRRLDAGRRWLHRGLDLAGHAAAARRLDPQAARHAIALGETARGLRDEFFARNLRLVRYLAARAQHCDVPLADLIQEGSRGLLRAIELFEPARGLALSVIAVPWIKAALGAAIADQRSLIRVPRNLRPRFEGALPEVVTSAADGCGADLLDTLSDPATPSQFEHVWSRQRGERLRTALESLSPCEHAVVLGQFGLGAVEPAPFAQIAAEHGLSEEQAHLVAVGALERLRAWVPS